MLNDRVGQPVCELTRLSGTTAEADDVDVHHVLVFERFGFVDEVLPHPFNARAPCEIAATIWDRAKPEFDSSKAHFRPTPSNGAGFRATGRQKPRYTGC